MAAERVSLIITAAIALILAGATFFVYAEDLAVNASSVVPDGRTVFQTRGCVGCHVADGVAGGGSIGPDLTKLSQVAGERIDEMTSEEYVRQSVSDPAAFAPSGYQAGSMPDLGLGRDEVDALVAFLLD